MCGFLFIFTYLCLQGFADELMSDKQLKGQNASIDDEVYSNQSKVQPRKQDHQEMQNIVVVQEKNVQQSGKNQSSINGTTEAGVAKKTAVHRAKVTQHPKLRFNHSRGNTSGHGKVSFEGGIIGDLLEIDPNSTNSIVNTIQTTGGVVGKGLTALVTKWDKTLIIIAMLLLGIIIGYSGSLLAQKYVAVSKPKIVFETSRIYLLEAITQPIASFTKAVDFFHKSSDPISGIVLAPALENRIRAIAIATKSARLNKGFYRNLLLLGPDGTGKTSVSKNLAKYCGMEYAIVLGSAVACLDKGAVRKINELFDWAYSHIKGVLLFISRADVFLQKRTSDKISGEVKAAIDLLLYRTSAPSKKVMLVLASNAPQNIDQAVYDRLNQIIEFELPGDKERRRIIHGCFDKFVSQTNSKKLKKRRLVLDQIDIEAVCSNLAARTYGMSGRALSMLSVAWQAAAYASDEGRLTEQMCIEICDDIVREHQHMLSYQ